MHMVPTVDTGRPTKETKGYPVLSHSLLLVHEGAMDQQRAQSCTLGISPTVPHRHLKKNCGHVETSHAIERRVDKSFLSSFKWR